MPLKPQPPPMPPPPRDEGSPRCLPVRSWPPPVEQTDPAARRACWGLWSFAAIVVAGTIAYLATR